MKSLKLSSLIFILMFSELLVAKNIEKLLVTEISDKKVPIVVLDSITENLTGANEQVRKGSSLFSFFEPLPFKLNLMEITKGVLRWKNYTLSSTQGRALVDMKPYVNAKKRGLFQISFEFNWPEGTEIEKVWYISYGKRRKVRDKVIGSGCHRALDITSYFKKNWMDGIKLSTDQKQYASAIVGDYFILAGNDAAKYLARIFLYDSRYKKLTCK